MNDIVLMDLNHAVDYLAKYPEVVLAINNATILDKTISITRIAFV